MSDRAAELRERHRVDVRYGTFAPVAVCSCGWRFVPGAGPDERTRAWAAAAAHREKVFSRPKREAALKGHATRNLRQGS